MNQLIHQNIAGQEYNSGISNKIYTKMEQNCNESPTNTGQVQTSEPEAVEEQSKSDDTGEKDKEPSSPKDDLSPTTPPAEDLIEEESVLTELEAHLTAEEAEDRLGNAEGLRLQGNAFFKERDWEGAALKYTAALRECPARFKKERAVMFANRAAAKVKVDAKKAAIQDCDRAIQLDPEYLKAYMRRAALLEEVDKFDEAAEDCKAALLLEPGNKEMAVAVQRLQHKIHERNEKMKEEAMKGLKSLGNLFLKPFGMSTDNFQMVPNETGGYSINFVQNQK